MAEIVDSYSESNYSSSYGSGGDVNNYNFLSQSFTGNGGVLQSVVLYLKKSGLPTGNATVSIYAHSGTYGTSSVPTGSALATSDNFDISTLTTSFALVTFTFTGAEKITLTNGTYYCLVLENSNGDNGNYVLMGMDGTAPTHSGNKAHGNVIGFLAAESWYDFCFYVYKDDALTTSIKDIIQPGILIAPR